MLMSVELKDETAAATQADPDELYRWYIVRAYAGAEWQLRKALLKRGVEVFLPLHIVDVRRNRWQQGEVRALFRGYIFVGLEMGQGLDEVMVVPGALHVVRIDKKPLDVTPAQIKSIRLQAADELMVSMGVKETVKRCSVGDWVAIPEGYKGAGTPVQIEAIDKRGEISASFGSLGTAKFPLSALECVDGSRG